VLIDINKHRITIALKPGEAIPVREIYNRIRKGGYDPVTMHLRLQGRVKKIGDTLRLHATGSGQSFDLRGDKANDLRDAEDVDLEARLDARNLPDWEDEEAIAVVVDKVLPPKDGND
jgi:hypothetical protein